MLKSEIYGITSIPQSMRPRSLVRTRLCHDSVMILYLKLRVVVISISTFKQMVKYIFENALVLCFSTCWDFETSKSECFEILM